MDKLISYLNEYEGGDNWTALNVGIPQRYTDEYYEEDNDLRIISKKFGFIKWLFENDKLDEEELQLTLCDELKRFYKDYEILIMQLSISDNPIEDLINLLK